jgi:tetratricopeptide (TPR) repeat protein
MARLAFILAVLLAGAARAADEPSASKGRVEDYASRAYELVAKGQYSEAVALYIKAYQVTPAPAILYNIGAIYDKRLQERELALDYYRRYLRSSELDPELARRAGERVEAIKDEVARHDARPATAGPNTSSPPVPKAAAPVAPGFVRERVAEPQSGMSGLKIGSLVVGGVGLVGVGVGLAFGAHARTLNNQALQQSCSGKTCLDQRGVDLTKDARSSATLSTVFVTIGGAAVLGGVAAFLLAPSTGGDGAQASRPITVIPVASAHGAGVLVRGEL